MAALQPTYLGVYAPDPRLTLAWGYESRDWREELARERVRPDWAPEDFKSVHEQMAMVVFGGAVVWQVAYAYADWGSGIGTPVPVPSPDLDDRGAYWMTEWEIEFARLLGDLQQEDEMDLIATMTAAGVKVRGFDPL